MFGKALSLDALRITLLVRHRNLPKTLLVELSENGFFFALIKHWYWFKTDRSKQIIVYHKRLNFLFFYPNDQNSSINIFLYAMFIQFPVFHNCLYTYFPFNSMVCHPFHKRSLVRLVAVSLSPCMNAIFS